MLRQIQYVLLLRNFVPWLGQIRERERHQGGKREDFQIQLTSSASFRVLAYKAEGRDKGG